jgi:hypothetical protein
MYCGGSVVIEEATKLAVAKNLKNWLSLAQTAAAGGNDEEAYDYYTRILECDLGNWEAWLGKGEAAGHLSSLANFRLREMLAAFTNAINYGDEAGIDLRREAAHILNLVTLDYRNAAQQHLAEFISLPETWNEYIQRCEQMTEAWAAACEYDPTEGLFLESMISTNVDLLQGRQYPDPYDGSKRTWYLTEHYRAYVLQKVDSWVAELKQLDPSYQPPTINKSSPCFVVTATFGDPDHATVALLRTFRDQVISKTNWGARILRVYSSVGPSMASQVARSRVLRLLSRHLLIAPAAAVARVFLAAQRRRTFGVG